MYSASTDRPQPPPNAGNIVRFGVIGFIALLIVLVVGKPAVALYMNIGEFDDQFTRPLFYSLVSAVILGIIALVRVNIVSRSSIFWYAISTLITFASSAQNQNIQNIQAYRKYKLSNLVCSVADYENTFVWCIFHKHTIWICLTKPFGHWFEFIPVLTFKHFCEKVISYF